MNKNIDFALLQVFYDAKNLKGLLIAIDKDPIIALFSIPYLSLFCAESPMVFAKHRVKLPSSFKSMYNEKNIRLKLKLFEDKYQKSENIVKKCDYVQDFIFRNKLLLKFLAYFNIHYNIGIFILDNKIIGNTQYAYYIFQDSQLLKLTNEELLNTEFQTIPEELKNYGARCGELVNIISSIGDKLNVNINYSSDPLSIKIKYKDLNTNRLFKNTSVKYINLYILHIMCNLNFVYYIIKKYDRNDYGLFMRIYYITYYYSITKIKNLKNYMNSNNISIKNLNSVFKSLSSIESYMDSSFRSCMMHYEFYNPKNNNELIKEELIDPNKLLFGLVESRFNGITYNELKKELLSCIYTLSNKLEEYLNIDITNANDF